MLDDLESRDEIGRLTERLLSKADAHYRFPTPVDDIVAAAGLLEPRTSMLASPILEAAPPHVSAAIKKLGRRVRAVLDRKTREIHLHPDIDVQTRRSFKKLHEVAHDVYPWQKELAYADDDSTLSWSTRLLFEREANQGAAELLFQRRIFQEVAAEYRIGMGSVIALAEQFGASIHATFRRYIESSSASVAGLVLEPSPATLLPLSYDRHEAIHSRAFSLRMGESTAWPRRLDFPRFDFLELVRQTKSEVPRSTSVVELPASGRHLTVTVEVFSNFYSKFVLLWERRREWFKKSTVVIRP